MSDRTTERDSLRTVKLSVVGASETAVSKAAWLALSKLHKVGPVKALSILEHFGSPETFFREKGYLHSNIRLDSLAIDQAASYLRHGLDCEFGHNIARDLKWLETTNGSSIIPFTDKRYPALLKQTSACPIVIYTKGDHRVIHHDQIALVGSRRATGGGIKNADNFAFALGKQGLAITSGLALGIDTAAHQGALRAGAATVAVLGNGLDHIYPKQNTALHHQILESGGLLVSEFPIGTLPNARNFPRRNRLISGLSVGVLVVEAAVKSGSLITARYALEQNREVFAIPGDIHSPQSKGSNQLIRQGAKLVDETESILEELPAQLLDRCRARTTEGGTVSDVEEVHAQVDDDVVSSSPNNPMPEGLSANEALIYRLVCQELQPLDMLVNESKLPVRQVMSIVTILELKGAIKSVAGGFVANVP